MKPPGRLTGEFRSAEHEGGQVGLHDLQPAQPSTVVAPRLPTTTRCRLQDAPPDWPAVQVLLVDHGTPCPRGNAALRALRRQRVHALLACRAGNDIAQALLVAAPAARGGLRASISHAGAWSLLAWSTHGRIGVDIVDLLDVADVAPAALTELARLYLAPPARTAIARANDATAARLRFAGAWAAHEAGLKCVGLALTEWTPALQARLDTCTTTTAAPWVATTEVADASGWVARIAWRAAA